MTLELKDYQIEGAKFLSPLRRAGLFDDMGLGKTAQTIRALDMRGCIKGMIICPAAVRQSWVGEFRKFARVARRVVKGQTISDFIAWARGACDVLVVSYEMAAKWALIHPEYCLCLDFLVFDESHYLKSEDAQRTLRLLGQGADGSGLMAWADTVWYLTGTPVPNDPIDIHTWLYSGGFTDLNRNAFRKEFFVTHPRSYSAAHEVKPDRIDELKALIGKHSIRRTLATSGLDLPPIFITETSIDGDTSAVKELLKSHPGLDKIIQELLEAGLGLSSLGMDVAGHIATLRRLIGEAKALPYAKLLLSEIHGGLDKVVVMGIHVRAIQIIRDFLTAHGVQCVSVTGEVKESEREKNMIAFQNDPECKVFLGNIRAAGVGLTLTAARRIDMFEFDWTPAGNAQAIKRVHRFTQTRSVLARFITLANSFDEIVTEIVAEKTRRIADIDEVGGAYAPPAGANEYA